MRLNGKSPKKKKSPVKAAAVEEESKVQKPQSRNSDRCKPAPQTKKLIDENKVKAAHDKLV